MNYNILIIALLAVAFCGCDPKEQQVNYTKQVNLDVSDGAHRLNKGNYCNLRDGFSASKRLPANCMGIF
mgnify:CR=1 FL=1